MVDRLGEEGFVHEGSSIENLERGMYTEIGGGGWYENVEMGDFSYTGPYCFLQNAAVGKYANVAAAVRIGPTMHPRERPTLHHFTYRRRMFGLSDRDDEAFFEERRSRITRIGHDTWIGHGAIVMPGLSVGDGSIIGSGAVVTKDVPPFSIVVGVPARKTADRFPPELAAAMSRIAWWDWPWELVKSRFDEFCGKAEDFARAFDPTRAYDPGARA